MNGKSKPSGKQAHPTKIRRKRRLVRHVIIDTNRLQSDELWAFLALSPDNHAVLPDYVAMESFKPARLAGLQARFKILALFPRQVIILKGTGDISRLQARGLDPAHQMVDEDQTAAFGQFCQILGRAEGDAKIMAQLDERAGWAQEHLQNMLDSVRATAEAMDEFRVPFTDAELASIRRQEPLTEAMGQKVWGLVNAMADTVFALSGTPAPPTPDARKNSFVIRNAMATAYYMVRRIRTGAILRNASGERNDRVDVLLATYGTYFDGVMSADELTNEIHYVVRDFARQTGAHTGGVYLEDCLPEVAHYLDANVDKAPGGGAERS